MAILKRLRLQGWKSVRDSEIQLSNLNVLIGANSAGKSNLLSFFKMLNEMIGERLQLYIGQSGGADSLLFYGAKHSDAIDAELEFDLENRTNRYHVRLFHAAVDTLLFADESITYRPGNDAPKKTVMLGSGHKETRLNAKAKGKSKVAEVVRYLIASSRMYHFHDTSATARVRQQCYLRDDRFLMPDGGNLAAILHRFRNNVPDVYERIRDTIRQVTPLFDDFDLRPLAENPRNLLLNWRERDGERIFGPHQVSDGTLRSMLLITLLLQPENDLPKLIAIDEPELGLHPYAIAVIASLIKRASTYCQVIIATQSPTLLDHFDADNVIVVDREKRESTFKRLNTASLENWLDEYSLSDVWEKNVVGGGPH